MVYYEKLSLYDQLLLKIYAYYQTIWREKWRESTDQAKDWLENFKNSDYDIQEKERINMLYLLTKFMYFGNTELRQMLISLYRDLFKYPVVESIRKMNGDTHDISFINMEFNKELSFTRFLGVGNPSESGVHLLYFFRQECSLSKQYFINTSEIFSTQEVTDVLPDGSKRNYLKTELGNKKIKRYIFIDDFCGSGDQAKSYLKDIVSNIKFEDKKIEVSYLLLFGTEKGLDTVRSLGVFDKVEAVFTLDETFKAFSGLSRYYVLPPGERGELEKKFSKETAKKYGIKLFDPALGHGNCELLLGMYHNTPDNSLPIFWADTIDWQPIFKRYHKF